MQGYTLAFALSSAYYLGLIATRAWPLNPPQPYSRPPFELKQTYRRGCKG